MKTTGKMTKAVLGAASFLFFLLVFAAQPMPVYGQLIGQWKFDEGSGTTALDSSGNGNTGELVGPLTYSTDTPSGSGYSLSFTNTPGAFIAATQYVSIPDPGNLPTSAISIAAWVKIPTSRTGPGAMVAVAKGLGGVADSFVLFQNTQFGPFFQSVFSFDFGGPGGGVGGPLIPEDGNWHHVAGTWASGGKAKLYLDGALLAESLATFTGTIAYNSGIPISIGVDFDPGASLGWFGNIDDVRIYGHALSNAEVRELVFGSTVQTVALDIKPGSFPNSINPRSKGVIPVAILTTGTFDATTVDPTTVLFGRTGTEAAPAHSALGDVDKDGDTDIILHFDTRATGIQCGDTSASFTGKTFSGVMIEGSDSVKTAGCN